MFKKTALVAGIGLALSAAAQADYQWEVGSGYSAGEIETNFGDADVDVFSAYGDYYLESVDTSKGPLGEAAFLDRASSVSANFSNGEIDADDGGDADISGYGLDGRYVWKDSGWLVDLGYQQDEIENEETDTFSIGGGKYILENTALVLSYANVDADNAGEADVYGLDVEQLWDLQQGALKLEAGYARTDYENIDDSDTFALGGTYYLNNNLGFGASYSNSDSDDAEIDTWRLYGEWFINDQADVSLGYESTEEDDTDVEFDAIMLSARFRF